MTETTDWNQWRGSWQTRGPSPEELTSTVLRFHHAKRRAEIIQVIEWAMVTLAAVFPLAAIRHAANLTEGVLGIGAVAIVVSVAAFRARNRRAERVALGTSAREFDVAVRSLRQAELRFVRFLWLVLGVEGVFAAVWWAGGIEAHHSALSPIALGMLWLPLVVVAVALGWSISLRAAAKRELAASAFRAGTAPETNPEGVA
jgi:hypothetical protein